ncbi:MAG: OmpA family protein [Bacteroidaceae bacterium]|jgi:OOP family OmpA-OmpF porin
MRKIATLTVAALLAFGPAQAQDALSESKFLDNWSVGANVGLLTPIYKSAFFGNMRPSFAVELTKMFDPTYGLSLELRSAFNTTPSSTAFDAEAVNLLGHVNLNNLFCGYPGVPRPFEVELVAGGGLVHQFVGGGSDFNRWNTKLGFNLGYNLGESKAFQVYMRPALLCMMDPAGRTEWFKKKNLAFELTAGVAYRFKNSNGTHYVTRVAAYNQGEVDELNGKINALRSENGEKDSRISQLEQQNGALVQANAALKQQVTELENRAPEKTVVSKDRKTLESVVTFGQGKTTVDRSQLPNVERIAVYMKHHPKSTVVIKGYASPEGSIEVNTRIANARAEAVRKLLVSTYGIASSRITAEGEGVGNMFSEPDWNRVSICTIDENAD